LKIATRSFQRTKFSLTDHFINKRNVSKLILKYLKFLNRRIDGHMNESTRLLSRLYPLLLCAGFLIYCLISVSCQRPLYFRGFQKLEREIYSFYSKNERLPDRQELSEKSSALLASNASMSYSPIDGLNYRYEKSKPRNITLIGILTFGIVTGDGERTIGVRLDPETLMHNARIHSL